ncbi:two-component regulator propeller domain-containing protein [Paraflavisolibacter sp. H34]|uniref:ligand-binding sensor domain-containing protein n=1 Tax=Huijunlia imazamoxiresistens TaxID=3127457 RepID=UPI00301A03B7
MQRLLFALLASLLLWCGLPLRAQSFYFRHYQVENGLSHNTVTCSMQDKMGFMWFGTKDGLNRFDGYTFKTFRKTPGKEGAIGSNNIHSLFLDKEGTLWVGTETGLYQYLDRTEEFRLAPATRGFYIDKIAEDKGGNLWFTSGYNLCRLAKRTGQLAFYDQHKYFAATSICTSPEGAVWIGTPNGYLEKYHPQSDSFSGLDLFGHSPPTPNRWIESLYTTADGQIWAGTSNTEIKVIGADRSTYTDITVPNSPQKNLYIRSILQTAPGEYWLGTESGIIVYNRQTGKTVRLQKDYNDPYSLTDNAIYTFCRDREGGVWAGTYFGGINYFPNQYSPFKKYFPKKGENSLGGNVVREIKEDRYGQVWIGTEDAGLNRLDPATGTFTRFQADGAPGSVTFFNIHGLLATGDELWIGTFHHGLDVLDLRSGKVVRHFNAGQGNVLWHNFIYTFYQPSPDEILITTPSGMFTYSRPADSLYWTPGMPQWNWYTSIQKDDKGVLWAGTFGNGLFYYNPATGKSGNLRHEETKSNSLGSNGVNSIFLDSRRQLWVATEEGLCRFNERDSSFTRYGTANGFPSNFILSILEDARQQLWIGTTRGLVRFHPPSGGVQVYTTANGLLSDQFNYNSAFKDAAGRMYFGSAKGLISFRPEEIGQSSFVPPVSITGFQVNNRETAIRAEGSPLRQSVTFSKKLTLNHRQSTFSIDFAALSYTAPDMTQYSYQMEGLSRSWINLKTNRRVYFMGLTPGTYVFRVKASNGNGAWSPQETKLIIVIQPPWWAGPLAYAAYILLAVGLVVYLVQSYHERMEEKNRRKFERLELAKEKEVLEAKMEFFTNVAHEIKTPLTLIKVPLAKVIRKVGGLPEISNSLQIMQRNTNRLVDLANQLLDFRQTEIHRFHLSIEQADISALVAEACAGFTSLAEQHNTDLSLQLPEEPFQAAVDVDAFNKIIYNLFGNAVKYAAARVDIALLPYFPDRQSFTIRVKNDGYLVPQEMKEKIFEPFFRLRETEGQSGTGIGLALSRSLTLLHNGTLVLEAPEEGMNVFSLTLPVHQEAAGNGVESKFSDENKTAI